MSAIMRPLFPSSSEPTLAQQSLEPSSAVQDVIIEHWRGCISLDHAAAMLDNNLASRMIVNEYSYVKSGAVLNFFGEELPGLDEVHLQTKAPLHNAVTDADLKKLIERRPNLKKVTLCACPQLTAEGLLEFLNGCKNLTEFTTDLACFNDDHVDVLLKRSVKVLNIGGIDALSLGGLYKIAQQVNHLTQRG